MGLASVRAAVVAWIRGQDIEGVQQIYKDAPWWIDGATFGFTPTGNNTFGAAVFVHLDSSAESRVSLPAPSPSQGRTIGGGFVGDKDVEYTVSIGILYRYAIPANVAPRDPDVPFEDAWVDGLDGIIDTLKDRLRSDPNLGAPEVIFQAAQGPLGIRIDQDIPTTDNGFVQCYARLMFTLDEIITA